MSNEKILIVEDDRRLCRLLGRYLERGGYQVRFAHDGDEMHGILQQDPVSLLLLDIVLPGKDGLALAQEVRDHSNIPIIFLTAKAEVKDKVNGLEIGADDYITKPFAEEELIARIHTVLRRSGRDLSQQKKPQAIFAGWRLNLIDQALYAPDGKQVDITSYEYQVLSALVNRPNAAISRGEILKMISGREWSPMDRSADMAISKLRKKLEDNPKKPALIRTIRNKGYQLTTTVEFIEPS